MQAHCKCTWIPWDFGLRTVGYSLNFILLIFPSNRQTINKQMVSRFSFLISKPNSYAIDIYKLTWRTMNDDRIRVSKIRVFLVSCLKYDENEKSTKFTKNVKKQKLTFCWFIRFQWIIKNNIFGLFAVHYIERSHKGCPNQAIGRLFIYINSNINEMCCVVDAEYRISMNINANNSDDVHWAHWYGNYYDLVSN